MSTYETKFSSGLRSLRPNVPPTGTPSEKLLVFMEDRAHSVCRTAARIAGHALSWPLNSNGPPNHHDNLTSPPPDSQCSSTLGHGGDSCRVKTESSSQSSNRIISNHARRLGAVWRKISLGSSDVLAFVYARNTTPHFVGEGVSWNRTCLSNVNVSTHRLGRLWKWADLEWGLRYCISNKFISQ